MLRLACNQILAFSVFHFSILILNMSEIPIESIKWIHQNLLHGYTDNKTNRQQTAEKHAKLPSMQRVNLTPM